MTRHVVILALAALATACATSVAPTSEAPGFDSVDTSNVRELPPSDGPAPAGEIGPDGSSSWLPSSVPIEHGVVYRFSLQHCGLFSPVDVDGSFWDAVDGMTASGAPLDLEGDSEMINATAGQIVVIGDEARFRTEGGSLVRFERHDGEKEFPPCM